MPIESSSDQSQLLRQQTILAQFGELALRSDSLDDILTEACRLVGEAFGTDLAKVVELQPDGKTLLVRAGIGWKEGVVGTATMEAKDNTSEAYALKTGEPMISPDIDRETRFEYAPFLIENGAKAVANVIIIGGKDRPPFGILQVDSRTPREFDDNDITFLRSYANLLAATVDRLRVMEEAKDGTARLRLALEAGELGSFEMDLNSGEIVRSSRYDEIFGRSAPPSASTRDGLLGQVVPEDRERMASALGRDVLIADGGLHVEARIRRAGDGTLRWIEMRGRADDRTTLPVRLVGVVADVTDRKLAEQSLTEANATLEDQVAERTRLLEKSNAQLDAFAYTVSHDLRAPLRAMEGFARILLDDFGPGLGQEGERYAGRIVGAANRMEILIDDLLTYSRVQRAEVALQAVDPERAVGHAFAELRTSTDALGSMNLDVETPLPLVRADRVILGQVIRNLIANAAKFRRQGEPVHVVVRAERQADRVRLWVEDDGIGIAPEHQQRIFNVFERLHGQETYPGTGVGLAIVKSGMERMGGTFGVVSALAQGSRFWIELAAAESAATAKEAGESADE
jgi:signal transduction histidine kinase